MLLTEMWLVERLMHADQVLGNMAGLSTEWMNGMVTAFVLFRCVYRKYFDGPTRAQENDPGP